MKSIQHALLAGLTLTLAGCGGNSAATPAPPAASPAPSITPAAPLRLDQRLVPGDLAGLQSAAGVTSATTKEAFVDAQSDPEDPEYAQEHSAALHDFDEKHFVAGALKSYSDGAQTSKGGSAVAQFASPQEALAYESAIYGDFGATLSPTATKGTVRDAAQSHTAVDTVTDNGQSTGVAWASFADGPFVYLVEAEKDGGGLDGAAVLNAAAALYAKVKGAPAP